MEEFNLPGIIPLLILLAIIGGIVYAIVAWRRREGLEVEAEAERGIGAWRRLYFYGASFGSLVVGASGVVLVGRYVLNELFGPPVLLQHEGSLAIGVALAVIWTPLWVWHWLRLQRYLREEPAERRMLLRKLYIYLTLTVAAALSVQAAVEVLRWAFDAKSFGGYALAALVVWGGLWAYHWWLESAEGQPTLVGVAVRRLYLYATSAYSLSMLAAGLGVVLYVVLREAYDDLFSVPRLLQRPGPLWSDTMKTGLSVALVGTGVWAWHWLYAARAGRESALRQFYAYGFAILGGVITTLTAAGIILYGVLVWLIGVPEDNSAAAHFRFLPSALPLLLVGIGLWSYHWLVVQQEQAAAGQLLVARRTYAYIMAALGLGALVAATIVLVPTVIGILVTSARDVLAGEDWWRNRIVLGITQALLGAPVWGYYWFDRQRQVAVSGPQERASLPRHILVYAVLVAGTVAFLGSLSFLLYLFLNALLANELSLTLLRDAKWSIGITTAAILFVPYYWLILREDRLVAAQQPVAGPLAEGKVVTVLIGEDGGAFVEHLERVLDSKVRVLRRVDPGAAIPQLSEDDLQEIGRRVAAAVGNRVLLVPEVAEVKVFSYR